MPLNKELLDLLACPVCKGALAPVDNEAGLECPACGLVREEAVRKDEWDRGIRQA